MACSAISIINVTTVVNFAHIFQWFKIIMHPLKMSLRPYKLVQWGNLVLISWTDNDTCISL